MGYMAEQGDILKAEHVKYPLLVVSKNTFNKTGFAVCCPVLKDILPGPLHIHLETPEIAGVVLCEQLKYLDLRFGKYSRIGSANLCDILDITDAVQGIFDYY